MWAVLLKWMIIIPGIFLFACKEKSHALLHNVYAGEGIASWYGKAFEGKRTANGDTFRKDSLTAAHLVLEFGTLVRVNNQKNGKEIVVEINDRGPFSKTRIIDLSEKAAREIEIIQNGFGPVKIEICGYDKVNLASAVKHFKNIQNIKKNLASLK
jgi:rare lipoprotein A